MERTKLVIWGASGHAKVVADIARLAGRFEIEGFLDDLHPESKGMEFCGATVLGGREQLERLHREGVRFLVFGFGDGSARLELSALAAEAGFAFPALVHPGASVAASARIGAGTVIAAGAAVNPDAVVGEHAIVNTGASVDHDCVIEDGAHICPGARLAGGVRVGRAAWIGIGTSIVEGVAVGAGAVVGAGSVVLKDVPPGATVYGNPARIRE